MLTNHQRLQRQKSQPALVELHRALSRLSSTLTVMNTGAHPDDEMSGMLAAMRFGFGIHIVILCSTRGEGGQNSLGPERTGALGIVRTRELEEAAKQLDADIAWVGHGPEDPVHDFGFSKNGVDTLERWGRDIVLERMVRAYRTHRPDIVIPTFLDVPGQHGHHRAMTEVAETAIALAADPDAYPDQIAAGLSPWQVGKYYLPAWSGGGATYDDEVPPPDATLTLSIPGRDPATGASWSDIGEWSRAGHASQGMGLWRATGQTEWPLHLKLGDGPDDHSIADHLPAHLGELADHVNEDARAGLEKAHEAIGQARQAFPHNAAIIEKLVIAADQIEAVRTQFNAKDRAAHGHRLSRKIAEIEAALCIAAGIKATAWAAPAAIPRGGHGTLNLHLAASLHVAHDLILPSTITASMPETDGPILIYGLEVSPDTEIRNAYSRDFSYLGGNGPVSVRISAEVGGRKISKSVDLDEAVQIVPAHSVQLEPDALIVPTQNLPVQAEIMVRLDGPDGQLKLANTENVSTARTKNGFSVSADNLPDGITSLSALVDGESAYRQVPIAYPHIGAARYISPTTLQLLALDLKLPENARIGYIGGGSDRVGLWMRRMGLDVTDLGTDQLSESLDNFTTIVAGTLAYGLRSDLFAARARINAWVEWGGHLLTLYHRPHDGWDPATTPPKHLTIGSPSLRWRVTDPAAVIDVLDADHMLLTGPNKIGPKDFAGWDKERGLYFAAEWDPAYVPLFSMHDKGEKPLQGALVSAPVGAGRHTHTSLTLHHQMDRLVPGAFRLLANLVQPVS